MFKQLFHDVSASGYSISNGDLIEIRGVRNGGEFARVDYIQLGGDAGSGGGDTGGNGGQPPVGR